MALLVHEAVVEQVRPGLWQGRCSASDFAGPDRDDSDAARADLVQHLVDKQLIAHRSGRYSYRVEHHDGTPPLSDQGGTSDG